MSMTINRRKSVLTLWWRAVALTFRWVNDRSLHSREPLFGGVSFSFWMRRHLQSVRDGGGMPAAHSDAATIDYETDAIIQESLRNERKSDTTVITIAHRLQTIMDSDKIVSFVTNPWSVRSDLTCVAARPRCWSSSRIRQPCQPPQEQGRLLAQPRGSQRRQGEVAGIGRRPSG